MRKKTKKTNGDNKETKLSRGAKFAAPSCDKAQKIIMITVKGNRSNY